MENDILNLEEARQYLKIGRNTLLKLAQEKIIPAQKLGRAWRFSKRALRSFIEGDIQTNQIKEKISPTNKTTTNKNSSEKKLSFNELLNMLNQKKNND